ncbi:MAG: 3-deoxy-manno-octulosonate-8-phosphatase KdsC [Gammaproteobacteria bacterium]|nr:MAG: 3-deoxy-manno-octulosonate-8-phosphatase KdsC [Gammaproteobacteria bacterium]RKZ72024.1 MAG: 3-deoxy-manno-octulosonate-8-phosphatase KdsC [Gammaproteobacteria bacterium]
MFKALDKEILNRAEQIELAIFDVDGVLTNGGLILGENGNEYKAFHSRDGLGLVMLRDSGCQIAVISGRTSNIVSERMAALGIEFVYQGQNDKGKALEDLLDKLNIDAQATAYVGDDFIDLPAMRRVGLSIAVADAHPLVIEHAHWITKGKGGHGAAREVCELIMHARGTLDSQIQQFLDD